MRGRGDGAPLPEVMFLVVVLLLANEVVTLGYGCRALKQADCAMAATPKHGGTVLMRAAAPPGPGEARAAVYGRQTKECRPKFVKEHEKNRFCSIDQGCQPSDNCHCLEES
uniref:Uncharacterized protein n=1 Tax=Oryza barthii TaxID=65489 RepID=A0A0D3F833_9ORYZ